jgi:hypothetical protein
LGKSAKQGVRKQLLRLQLESFHRLQAEIQSMENRENRSLKAYRRRYEHEVRRYARLGSKAKLLLSVGKADIIFCGDYHTLRQAQRTAVRILHPIAQNGRRIALGLEMIHKGAEKAANDYVQGKIDEQKFLSEIEYESRWGFPWPHYKQLFDFAANYAVPIIGLSSNFSDDLPLEARDDLAADFIAEAVLTNPDRILFCLYGDLHIAEPHLPERVRVRLERYGLKKRYVTIFQNSEAIYWGLAAKGLESAADVVEIDRNRFCILSAAPWVKLQSYKSWLEDQGNLLEDSDETDFYHQVLELALKISAFLGVVPPDLEHFSVLTAQDVNIIGEIEKYTARLDHSRLPIRKLIRTEILENQSCYIPEKSILYLSDLSENRAAEKAGQLVASKLSVGAHDSLYEKTRTEKELFYRLVLWEAVGFLGSKVINPKRKCDQYRDLKKFVSVTKNGRLPREFAEKLEIARNVLVHRRYELKRIKSGHSSGFPKLLLRLPPRQLFHVTRKLGLILGHRMYAAMAKERIGKDTIGELFLPLPDGLHSAQRRYWMLVARTRKHDPKDLESKEDRF